MNTLLHISVNFSTFKPSCFHDDISKKPTYSFSLSSSKFAPFHQSSFKLKAYGGRCSFLGCGISKAGVLLKEEGRNRRERLVVVRFNQGFGFNGGGGGGRDDGATARLLGNLALAGGLTYLSMTGQLGWVLDAIVSIWLFAVLIPIVGIGAFIWWAGRDIVQDACPNCGNEFQIFKSSLNDDLQLCPFCSQPFSVVGNEFVQETVKFSNQSTTFGQAFNNFTRSSKGNNSAAAIDVEAEIKDAD
ncbi:U3 small nucleolar RNA-associated protein 14 B isoform 3 [Quillaja saponaria]|uniref:U3 small nucleolar RNA-associated protein 14 B isoform 3 n=1 Tax=Quillaja saponaria TaxID=32244 RepID=A0AAD7QHR3_QUISA|nr:U3 small nucleolar RNA-associated protein 14 B isoform 3 [Quillaja saponaria]